jgi:tetratricopeptide (TPR) repeat protein
VGKKRAMPVDNETAEDFDALMAEAYELLDHDEPEQALEIGRRLEKVQYSGGFEIQALAHQDLDENEKAIRVLRRGTGQVTDVWLLWQLLGNCLSDDEQYEEALTAYDKAVELPDTDRVSVQYNRAILLWRMDRLDDANAVAEELLNDPEFAEARSEVQANIRAARVGILSDLGRGEEAVTFFETLPDTDEWSESLAEVARLDAKYAIALWNDDRVDEARTALARAIRHDKTNSDAQWLKREMHARDLPGGKFAYDLMICGPWRAEAFPGTDPAVGFCTKYQVVADHPEQALAFIREFEPSEIRLSLEIEEVLEEKESGDPKGVYWTSVYQFYRED